MPSIAPNTTTTNSYVQLLGGSGEYAYGTLTIANNPVSLIIQHGTRGNYSEDEYSYVTPSTLPLVGTTDDRIVGVKIKSAIAGTPAQVSGWLIEPNVAGIQPGAAFTSQVAASGTVTPGQASVQIQKNGVLIGTEPIIDFVDSTAGQLPLAVADDAANTRVTVSGTMPGARVRSSVNRSIASGVGALTSVTFDTVTFDEASFWAAGSPTRFTIPAAGKYLVVAGYRWGVSAAGTNRIGAIVVNGGTQIARVNQSDNSVDNPESTLSAIWKFSAADFVELGVAQDSGGALNIEAFSWSPFLSIVRVG